MAGNGRLFLAGSAEEEQVNEITTHERSGRPLGYAVFIEGLETVLNRPLKRGKPRPKGDRNRIYWMKLFRQLCGEFSVPTMP